MCPLFYLPRVSVPGARSQPSAPAFHGLPRPHLRNHRQVCLGFVQNPGIGESAQRQLGFADRLSLLPRTGPRHASQLFGHELFGLGGPYFGQGLAYYIRDTGKDNLGLDRRRLDPSTNNRYRLSLRHCQKLDYNVDLIAEVGLLSDRNFLEQYYENEFDNGKDQETLLYLRQIQT